MYLTELVSQYQSALKKNKEAEKDREQHFNMMTSPETLKKKQEMEKKKKELEDVERQIGMLVDQGVRPENNSEPFYFYSFHYCLFLTGLYPSCSIYSSKTRETGASGCWWALRRQHKKSKAETHIMWLQDALSARSCCNTFYLCRSIFLNFLKLL